MDCNFLNQKELKKIDIESIIWHEIGHILSIYCYNNHDKFEINKRGRVCTDFINFFRIGQVGDELHHRSKIIDLFWAEIKNEHAESFFNEFEQFISSHLTSYNSRELLAECYKYAHGVNNFYSYNDPYILLAKNVVYKFSANFIL